MGTVDEGAAAAGLSAERYQFIRTTMASAVVAIAPVELLGSKNITPAMAAQMKADGEQQLRDMSADIPSDVVAKLRPIAATLGRQNMALALERLKVAQGR
jgi:hypothetical protein